MQVEDLLKNYSIPELRELVVTIEAEANAKQTELQHMVGSKYHDFIQSADLITNMQRQAQELEDKLKSFWDSSKILLDKTQDLLDRTDPSISFQNLQLSNASIGE